MPRKFFRRFLPSHDSVKQNRYISWFGPWLQHHNLWHLHRKSVAGGVAAGLFAGLVPGSNPVQFVVAALLAIAGHVNLPIALLVTLYSNPLTVVPLYYVAFKLGQFVMLEAGNGLPPLALDLEGKGFREWIPAALEWLSSVGKPLIIGLPLLAVILALVGYFVVDYAWQLHVRYEWSRRRRRRAARHNAKA
jgi:uncharacterized protein (DUF2062 family)